MKKKLLIIINIICAGILVAQEIDIYTIEMSNIKKEYFNASQSLENKRKQELKQILESSRSDAEKQQRRQKIRGNISAMAAAQKMIRQIDSYNEELDEKGDFELSKKTRRETKAIHDKIADAKPPIDEKYAKQHDQALEKAKGKFKNAAVQQNPALTISSEKLNEYFDKLIDSNQPTQTEEAETGTNDVEKAESVDPLFADYMSRQKKDVIKSGESEQWKSIATIKGAVNNIEIFRIPVTELDTAKVFSGITGGNAYSLEYSPIEKVKAEVDPVFMIRNLNSEEKFEVVSWPSEVNKWNLILRLRPGKEIPSNHRLEFLAGGENYNISTNKNPEQIKLPYVKIQIKSIPDKSYVYINNKPYRKGAKYVKTPCIIIVPNEEFSLSIRNPGYKIKTIEKFQPENKQTYSYVLIKNKTKRESTIKLNASDKGWKSSDVQVSKGDTYVIYIKGEWIVGKGGEKTDYLGYPDNSTFFKYYIEKKYNPSISANSNYGAVIGKIGKNGKPFIVKSGKENKADLSGTIYYTVNEKDAERSDNNGFIYIKTQIK